MATNTPLKDEMDSMMARFARGGRPQVVERITAHIERMARDGLEARALPVGAVAPDFTLPNLDGNPVRLSRLLTDGPVVLAFYRGQWCPWCNVQLRAYQAVLPQIRDLGACLVAVSPQDPGHTRAMAEDNGLDFFVLSDPGNRLAHRYGLDFSVEQPVREVYQQLGFPLPAYNGDDTWALPVPGAFVIGTDGTVRLSDANPDFTRRLEPRLILESLAALSPYPDAVARLALP
jgi:peroxiredoxin